MKEKKELAYSRALVPIKRKKYKIIVSVLLIVIIIVAIISLAACSEKENIKLSGGKNTELVSLIDDNINNKISGDCSSN